MKLEVPAVVAEKLKQLRDDEESKRKNLKGIEEAHKTRERAIAVLRASRYDELWKYASFVFEWRQAFLETPEGRELWRTVAPVRLPIFVARFWLGEPDPESVTTRAVLTLERWTSGITGYPIFWYEERHKAWLSAETRISCVQELVEKVHPEFLKQLYTHLNGPDAWKYILSELDRRLPR